MATASESTDVAEIVDDFSAEEAQLAEHFEARDRELAKRGERLQKLLAAARQEREQLAVERAESETLKLAVEQSRSQFAEEVARFNALRSEFLAAAAEGKERLRDAWAEFESHRQRVAAERAELREFHTKQEAAQAARAADLVQREKAVANLKARLETETTALRLETAGLEARAVHARAIVEELERKRDALRAELLAAAPKPESEAADQRVALDRRADRDLVKWVAELDDQDRRLTQEKANLARLKTSLEWEATSLADQRKVLAEQFAMLAAARSDWQDAEGRTVAEMEELARGLRLREEELAAREERWAQIESLRKAESHDLEQLRARLEAWQTKLATVSDLWHAERERRERELAERELGVNPFAIHPPAEEPDRGENVSQGLAALRGDFERTTQASHEPPQDEELPWASEEVEEEPNVFQFAVPPRSRAA